MQSGLCTSRGTGAVINVSCCLVLIPVCQYGYGTWSRRMMSKWSGHVSPYLVRAFLNRAKTLHMTCAFTIVVASSNIGFSLFCYQL